jgi:hypothetical protein
MTPPADLTGRTRATRADGESWLVEAEPVGDRGRACGLGAWPARSASARRNLA